MGIARCGAAGTRPPGEASHGPRRVIDPVGAAARLDARVKRRAGAGPKHRELRPRTSAAGRLRPMESRPAREVHMAKHIEAEEIVDRGPERRQSVVDRRSGLDRRKVAEDQAAEASGGRADQGTNLERRRGPGRRRTDFMRSAEEGEMTQEQFLFVMAIDVFKRVNGKSFPSWTDVLEVIRKLGYRKTMPSELNLGPRCEDWTERADSPAGVFKEVEEEDSE
jgi:hypothetical protein